MLNCGAANGCKCCAREREAAGCPSTDATRQKQVPRGQGPGPGGPWPRPGSCGLCHSCCYVLPVHATTSPALPTSTAHTARAPPLSRAPGAAYTSRHNTQPPLHTIFYSLASKCASLEGASRSRRPVAAVAVATCRSGPPRQAPWCLPETGEVGGSVRNKKGCIVP
jgi:hypothetical protein